MADNIYTNLRKYLPSFYSNGEWVEKPTLEDNGRPVDKEIIDFISRLYHLLIESDMLCEQSKMWLTTNLTSVRALVEYWNETNPEIRQLNQSTVQNKIFYDKQKLEKYFDEDIVYHVIKRPEDNLEKYSIVVDKLQRLYMKDKAYRDALVIKLPKDNICYSIDDYSWAQLTKHLELYSKQKIKAIESGKDKVFNSDMIGYYNYLISSKQLTTQESARLNEIKIILGID